jgi:hypothetical protein
MYFRISIFVSLISKSFTSLGVSREVHMLKSLTFSLAIRLGLSTKDLKDPILYSYPTNSSDVVYML